MQVKSGKAFLKEYYLKHRALSEKDLDELVAKSSMSYEQVRDWFSETARRAEEGTELFSDEEAEEEEEEATVEHADSEGEMEVKEQGEEASDDDCVEEDEKDAEEEEEEDEEIQEGSEGFSQSQPQAEEQT